MKWISELKSRANTFREKMSLPQRAIGLSLMRLCLGIVVLEVYMQHWRQYAFLWGNDGVVPYSAFVQLMRERHELSLYMLSPSGAVAKSMFVSGILVTAAFALGFKTRITSVLFYIFTWSLYSRDPFLLDGGDNLLYLLAFYLMFTECGLHFSLDASNRRADWRPNPKRALVSNFAVAAIVCQLCILYLTSATSKIQGAMWQNGTALYYILRTAEFNLSKSAHYFYDSDYVVTVLTWSTVLFQLSWPFLVWFKKPRPFLFLGAALLHASIGYYMGLVWFSGVMITAELIIFSDMEYVKFFQRAHMGASWTAHVRAPRAASVSASDATLRR